MTNVVLIFWTSPNMQEAEQVVRGLLVDKVIACANIVPKVVSMYSWKSSIEKQEEVLVFMKSTEPAFKRVKEYISKHCSYDVPEILQVNVDAGLPKYLNWVVKSVDK